MSALDYIRIRGVSASATEVFQGIAGAASSEAGTAITISQDNPAWSEPQTLELYQGLWEAQNQQIQEQSNYLAVIKEQLGDSQTQTGFWGFIWTVFKAGIGEEIVQQAIAEAIEHYFSIPDDAAELIVAFFMGFVEGIMSGLKQLDEGSTQCQGMINENTTLLTLPKSSTNYTLRSNIFQQHQSVIVTLVSSLHQEKSGLSNWVDLVIKLYQLLSGGSDDLDEWEDVIDGLNQVFPTFTDWIEEVFTADESNNPYNPANLDADGNLKNPLPVPAPPNLPPIPSKKNPKIALAYTLAKIVIHLGTEYLRRQKEHDPDMAEALQALTQEVSDLKFNGVRYHAQNGDIVELTGIGTIAENYNS